MDKEIRKEEVLKTFFSFWLQFRYNQKQLAFYKPKARGHKKVFRVQKETVEKGNKLYLKQFFSSRFCLPEENWLIDSFQVIHFSQKYKFLYLTLEEVDEM